MRIKASNQSVGIGTTGPPSKLSVNGDNDTNGDIISRTVYAASSSRQIGFKPRWGDGLGFGEYGMRFTSGPTGNEQNGTKLHFYMAGNNKVTIFFPKFNY